MKSFLRLHTLLFVGLAISANLGLQLYLAAGELKGWGEIDWMDVAGEGGAAVLALIGAIGILDDAYADLGYLAPAVAWALLGRVVLGAEPLPPQPRPTPRTRPAGSPPAARKPRQKRKPKRR